MTKPTIELTASGDFLLRFPDAQNALTIPATERGLACLARVLRGRAEGETKIGLQGNPTQYIVEEWLRHNAPKRPTFTLNLEGIDL